MYTSLWSFIKWQVLQYPAESHCWEGCCFHMPLITSVRQWREKRKKGRGRMPDERNEMMETRKHA